MCRWVVFAFLVFFLSGAVAAEDAPISDSTAAQRVWMSHLQKCLAKVFSLKGDFSQEIQCDNSPLDVRLSGTFEVKRKGKYRWNYTEPEGHLMISDGTTSFHYDKTAGRVYMGRPADAILSGVAKLLVGEADDSFFVEYFGGTDNPDNEMGVVQFTPKEQHPFIRSVLVTLSAETPCLKRIIVVDTAGCIIRTTFQNIRSNIGMKDNRFRFNPPKNTVIVNP